MRAFTDKFLSAVSSVHSLRKLGVTEWVSRHVAETQNPKLNDLSLIRNPLFRSENKGRPSLHRAVKP